MNKPKEIARARLQEREVPLGRDYHELTGAQQTACLDAAKAHRYRKSPSAPGSRARMFYEYANKGAAPPRDNIEVREVQEVEATPPTELRRASKRASKRGRRPFTL